MKILAALTWGALLLASTFALAYALPGDRFSDAKAAARAKGFAIRCPISEMSGAPFCTATGKVAGRKFFYNFSDDAGHVNYEESLTYDAPGFSFLSQPDPRIRVLLSAVFSDAVAQDFASAKLAAKVPVYQSKAHAAFLRGKRFGYATGGNGANGVTLFRASDLAQEIATARKCATMECGD
ncbi:MAG: hypothetical protein GIW97_05860 [Candidatus Eremiobacteraeota bacterium]|nr:hypothetical protein [Candidatus Eremiobacteraeota bacterium]